MARQLSSPGSCALVGFSGHLYVSALIKVAVQEQSHVCRDRWADWHVCPPTPRPRPRARLLKKSLAFWPRSQSELLPDLPVRPCFC